MKNKNIIKFFGILVVGLAIVLTAILLFQPKPEPAAYTDELKKFSSLNEIKDFLKINSEAGASYGRGEVMETMAKSADSSGGTAQTYSTTNIQVEGVDEADIVKNDGKYIYAVNGNKIYLIDAYPAENMKVLSEINISGVSEIYLNQDKLIAFSQDSVVYAQYGETAKSEESVSKEAVSIISPRYSKQVTKVSIYDISDKEAPKLEQKIRADGYYVDSRMIGDYVYLIASKQAYYNNPEPPVYILNDIETKVPVEEVYYFDYPDSSYAFTSIYSINTQDEEINSKVYLTGYTNNIYVSQENIYLTYTKSLNTKIYYERLIEEVYLEVLFGEGKIDAERIIDSGKNIYEKINEIQKIIFDYSNSLTGKEKESFDERLQEKLDEFQDKISKETEKTVIHKIHIDKEEIEYKSKGEVPGTLESQFSLDEYKGNLRIATTTSGGWRTRAESKNHLYVLDENLDIIGKVEDLAKGERIYSVRYVGKRAYMVTFRQVDPLFVIDLSDAEAPAVLGYLKVTGFSDYLHPYDDTHIIGVGKEADEQGRVKGVKISLFDVSDVFNPKEIGKYEITEGKWSQSEALYDHKAFLFNKEKNMLVIPVSYSDYQQWWQGAYVLNINPQEISLKGKITHETNESREYGYSGSYVRRSLFMDNFLYTISDRMVKANNLNSLEDISKVEFPFEEPVYVYAQE